MEAMNVLHKAIILMVMAPARGTTRSTSPVGDRSLIATAGHPGASRGRCPFSRQMRLMVDKLLLHRYE